MEEERYKGDEFVDIDKEDTSSNEIITQPFSPNDIELVNPPMNLGDLIDRIDYGWIDFNTEYQRQENLWSLGKQSRLIESALLGLRLPAFYFEEVSRKCWKVIDGLQRCCAIRNYCVDLRESVKDQNIKRKRAKLLHLSFSKNKPGDVKEILSVLDTFDPLSEFYKELDLIKLLVKVIKFLDRLMVSMDKEVTIENQKHLDKIRSMSSSLRDMIECKVKDKAQKEELLTSINDNEFKIIDLLNNR